MLMTEERAKSICKMQWEDGVACLKELHARKDEDGIYWIGHFAFFQCFPDSPTLYFEY